MNTKKCRNINVLGMRVSCSSPTTGTNKKSLGNNEKC